MQVCWDFGLVDMATLLLIGEIAMQPKWHSPNPWQQQATTPGVYCVQYSHYYDFCIENNHCPMSTHTLFN